MKRFSLCYRHPQGLILYSLSLNCQEQKTHLALTKTKRFDRMSLTSIRNRSGGLGERGSRLALT